MMLWHDDDDDSAPGSLLTLFFSLLFLLFFLRTAAYIRPNSASLLNRIEYVMYNFIPFFNSCMAMGVGNGPLERHWNGKGMH